jgi:hypothetical protein
MVDLYAMVGFCFQYLYKSLLTAVPFFMDGDDIFLTEVCTIFKTVIFLPVGTQRVIRPIECLTSI